MTPGDIVQCVDSSPPQQRPLRPGEPWVIKGDLYSIVDAFPSAESDAHLVVVRHCGTGAVHGSWRNSGGLLASRFRPFIEKPPADAQVSIEERAEMLDNMGLMMLHAYGFTTPPK